MWEALQTWDSVHPFQIVFLNLWSLNKVSKDKNFINYIFAISLKV